MSAPTIDIQPLPDLPNSWHMIRALGGIGVVCSLLIVLTYQWTLPVIEANKAAALERAILHVLPGAVEQATFELRDDGNFAAFIGKPTGTQNLVYAGYTADGELVGLALQAAGQGFQDVIRLIYGYNPQLQHVIGMEVLDSRETPGLGDKIIKDADFVANFAALDVSLDDAGTDLQHSVVAVKNGKKTDPWQIDGITGATISSVAVAAIIDASAGAMLPALQRHLDQLQRPPELQRQPERD